MRYNTFEEFFKAATGHNPYQYQKRLADSPIPDIINVPTGAGKTEAAVLGLWLWKRQTDEKATPRRLVYCLPMRVLVEQTKSRIETWLRNLHLDQDIKVKLLMGGSEEKIQEILPYEECIMIGTQDMLVSGALNRAYGNSPNMWPVVFGLLNNDCMWIMDEIQIMENSLPTSIQLNHFRDRYGTYGPHKTVWMSATVNRDWFKTVDSPKEGLSTACLTNGDADGALAKRNDASKTLLKAPIEIKDDYSKKDVEKLLDILDPKYTTVIIVNTVRRAQKIYDELSSLGKTCKLVHSRFRSAQREGLNKWLSGVTEDTNSIIIATQVIEAGVDISANTMITEIAPWSNLVQRFGRCNRTGNFDDSKVYWIDIAKDEAHKPYETDSIEFARQNLEKLEGRSVSPSNLPEYSEQKFFDAVLRRRDIIELFDNTSDLSGAQIDISGFVRSMERSLNVDVFWRDGKDDEPKPQREEICSVPVHELKEKLKGTYGWVWSYTDKEWQRVTPNKIFPGQVIRLDSSIGGYTDAHGWHVDHTERVAPVDTPAKPPEAHDGDLNSIQREPVTLEDHTMHVVDEVGKFVTRIPYLDGDIRDSLLTAAKYHDVGKVHDVFQNTMRNGLKGYKSFGSAILAKTQKVTKHERPGFRHEVASTLMYLAHRDRPCRDLEDLVAYIIMSHHGKVRMSLRNVSREENTSYVLGLENGETIQECRIMDLLIPATRIDTHLAELGRDGNGNPSWTERAIKLRDKYGPFRISLLEAIFRKADWSASEKEEKSEYG